MIKESIESFDGFDYTDDGGGAFWGWYEKPLSDFIPMEDQHLEIITWFHEKMDELVQFQEMFDGIGWE
ncbi:hypothetical protein SAMN05216389_103106 [Oceanobacillus limi]|uniref:Uncharacterized protein n=2 Tax=Oceanobacillus limi TaxID=930131 RepID=A0A1I0A781_9BACI|nr:hypothetical protein SAMN05216389_103106 [Oceanobacillus limi]